MKIIDLTVATLGELREITDRAARLISERECMSGLGLGPVFQCSLEHGHDGPHECHAPASEHNSMMLRHGYRVTWERVLDGIGLPIK